MRQKVQKEKVQKRLGIKNKYKEIINKETIANTLKMHEA